MTIEGSVDREGRLDEIVGDCLDRLNAGEHVDAMRVLEEYPDEGPEVLEALRTFVTLGTGANSEAPIGTLGDYTLRRQIGRGGMGVVYEAWENSMDRAVALKVLPSAVAADERALQRFVREAKTAGQLSHRNVVGVHAMGVQEQTPYYAMELVNGDSLAQILAQTKDAEPETETPFGKKDDTRYFADLAECFADVADGLQHAHSKGVIHRDIKPSNLILDGDGRLRVLDFGLARLEGQDSLTLSGDFVGTPLYMSPEQARRKRIPVDHRTDVYSLGATMYESICGRPPFRGKDHADTLSQIIERDPVEPRKVNPRVPKDFETVLLKCLRKNSSDRYGTVEALGQDLRRFVRGDPVEARPQLVWERVAARVQRNWTRLTAAVVFVALVGILAVVSVNAYFATIRARSNAYEPAVREALALLGAERFAGDNLQHIASRFISEGGDKFDPFESSDFSMDFVSSRSLERARDILERAAADVPRRPDAHFYLARVWTALGDLEKAKGHAWLALRGNPDFVPARWILAELEPEGTRARADATADLERFDGTNTWQEHWIRSERARRDGKWDIAANGFAEIIARGFERAPYVGWLAEAYLGRGTPRSSRAVVSSRRRKISSARPIARRASNLIFALLRPTT